MQDKDSEALRSQRERRKRVGRIKSTLIFVIAGWIVLSMILIICLFIQMISLNKKVDSLMDGGSAKNSIAVEDTEYQQTAVDAMAELTAMEAATEEVMDWEPVTPPAVGVSEEENDASATDEHKVYLTFDEGPSENTLAILDILKKYDVKATFFVIGKEDEDSRAIYQRIVEEGHTLGMHSYSNKYSVIYQSREAFEEDFHALKDYLYEVTGVECKYYRFPGGSSNQISNIPMDYCIHYLNTQGVIYYDWNVSSGDAANAAFTTEEMVENVTEDVLKYKTSVVLLHDSEDKAATVELVGPLIEALQNMDAQILPIGEETQVIQYVKADSVE